MSRSATHRLFSIAMKSPRNKIDFVSFSEIAMSLIVFARANSKSDEEISEKEMLISLEHGVLPSRYNKEIINDIFKLTKNDEGNVMDLFSFVFYDKYIRMFEMPFDADKKKGEYRYVCCAIDDIGCFFIFVVSVSYPEK